MSIQPLCAAGPAFLEQLFSSARVWHNGGTLPTMDRRDAVKKLAAIAGGTSMLPILDHLFPASQFAAEAFSLSPKRHPNGWSLQGQGGYSPQFFSPAEFETVDTISELIIPATDTPGARAAGVAQYLDMLLAETVAAGVETERTNDFRAGLRSLSQYVQQTLGQQDFSKLTAAQQTQVLRSMSEQPEKSPGREFFALMKDSTLYAYYTSKVGMEQELHYHMDYRDSYPGCTHPEHQQ